MFRQIKIERTCHQVLYTKKEKIIIANGGGDAGKTKNEQQEE